MGLAELTARGIVQSDSLVEELSIPLCKQFIISEGNQATAAKISYKLGVPLRLDDLADIAGVGEVRFALALDDV